MERMATGQAEIALEVERRQHLPRRDGPADSRRHRLEHREDAVPERLASILPARAAQPVRRVLRDHAHHVRSGAGALDDRRIGE
jgi:hypothetical protein